MDPIEKDGILYKLLEAKESAETQKLIVDIFVEDEYLTRESGITKKEFAIFAKDYCDYTIIHKLSFIAIDQNTNDVIGFIIAEDPYGKDAIDPNKFLTVSDHFIPFNAILEELHHCFLNIPKKEGVCYHSFLWGIKLSHRRRGILRYMNALSEQYALARGFKYVLVEATSPPTKFLCDKDGYTNLGNIPYQDYVLNGKKPFGHITSYDGPYLHLKKLSHNE